MLQLYRPVPEKASQASLPNILQPNSLEILLASFIHPEAAWL